MYARQKSTEAFSPRGGVQAKCFVLNRFVDEPEKGGFMVLPGPTVGWKLPRPNFSAPGRSPLRPEEVFLLLPPSVPRSLPASRHRRRICTPTCPVCGPPLSPPPHAAPHPLS